MPPASAHTTKFGHENRTLSRSNAESGACFRIARYAALISLSATIAPSTPVIQDSADHALSRVTIARTRSLLTSRTVPAEPG